MTKLSKPVRRLSSVALDGSFGSDKGRNITITIHPNGTLELRPLGTRRPETIHLLDAYRFAIRCRVGRDQLEKARERKAKKAVRLAAQRQQRAEKRLTRL